LLYTYILEKMHQLPKEIRDLIYSFDRTYRDIFHHCLFDISEKLYVKFRFHYVHPIGFLENAWIEEYRFLGMNPRVYTDAQLAKYLQQNKKYKFLVETYFTSEQAEFVAFYQWFNANLENVVAKIGVINHHSSPIYE